MPESTLTPPEPPEGCETTEDHERKFTETADLCEQLVRDLTAEQPDHEETPRAGRPRKTSVDVNAVAKIIDAGIKARRAACNLARQREELAEYDRLERLDDELAGDAH